MRGFTTLPLGRIALWGFGLNTIWEFGQCPFLYDMWDWGFWRVLLLVGFVVSIALEWLARALGLWG